MTRNETEADAPESAIRRVKRMQQSGPADRAAPLRRIPKAGWPEWYTDRWKRDVEAEARKRLKQGIRGVGADR